MAPMEQPDLAWAGSRPVSNQFQDGYFSEDDGLAESKHVFLGGIGAPEIWVDRSDFVICETGFGTGLNFLSTWQLWRATAPTNARLHFISVEKYPLSRDELVRALGAWPELRSLALDLAAAYPPAHRGFHRMIFEGGRVCLTLLFGDVTHVLSELTTRVDAWYLDGFAPSQNPEMWSEHLFRQMSRLSASGAKVATFTVAGAVRRGLIAEGFVIEKVKGFGRKRECLSGAFSGEAARQSEPWYGAPAQARDARIAVIGAGISGLMTAKALQLRGRRVQVFEKGTSLGRGGSGNEAGLLNPRPIVSEDAYGLFYELAYLYALRYYDGLGAKASDLFISQTGLLHLSLDAITHDRFEQICAREALPKDYLELISRERASALAGVALASGGLYLPKSGALRPDVLLETLAKDLDVQLGVEVTTSRDEQGQWNLHDGDRILGGFDVVVYAAGAEMAGMGLGRMHSLKATRGQVSITAPVDDLKDLKVPITGAGYVLPAFVRRNANRAQLFGATFDFWEEGDGDWSTVTLDDHQRNLRDANSLFAHDFKADEVSIEGRAALRSAPSDHMPICGPVPIDDEYQKHFFAVSQGARGYAGDYGSAFDNRFVLTGLGARGLVSAPLLAEHLAAQICGQPSPLPQSVVRLVHPGRFLFRMMRRGEI